MRDESILFIAFFFNARIKCFNGDVFKLNIHFDKYLINLKYKPQQRQKVSKKKFPLLNFQEGEFLSKYNVQKRVTTAPPAFDYAPYR